MKTFGAVFDSLSSYLSTAAKSGSNIPSDYALSNRLLRIHRAFDQFCEDNGIAANRRREYRQYLGEHVGRYPHIRTTVLDELFLQCPPNFMVRGLWVSEKMSITLKERV